LERELKDKPVWPEVESAVQTGLDHVSIMALEIWLFPIGIPLKKGILRG
jgi:hypothetical protein